MLQGDFADAITTCEPLLSYLPKRSSQRVEVLALSGLAHGMLQYYEQSYDLFTEALTIDSTNAELWYNHGLACRYTTRLGQAVRDFERAVVLSEKNTSELARKFAEELKISRQTVWPGTSLAHLVRFDGRLCALPWRTLFPY
jgi:tetratricopeptide (TPR) repeat protein